MLAFLADKTLVKMSLLLEERPAPLGREAKK